MINVIDLPRNDRSLNKMQFNQLFSSVLLYFSVLLFSSMTLAVSLEFGSNENYENLTEHLARRLRRAKAEIAKEYMIAEDDTESVVTVSYDIKWEKLRSERFNFSETVLAISIFDKMFILEGNRTMLVDVKTSSNDTSFAAPFHQPAFIRQGRSIKFAKSIVWKSRLYLLVCEQNDCNLYIGENDRHLEHGQTMNHKGMFDATFFTRDNRLYLVLTHDKTDEYLGTSTIYHWTGTYMDIIQPIGTVDDVLVTAFNYGRSTIIVFGQTASDAVGLEIYEFSNNRINRIQYLPANGPIEIIHYHHERRDFLLIINEREASSVYWWDGDEFLHWLDLSDIVAPSRVNVVHLNGDTIFFVSYENSVHLYKVTATRYSRLNLLDLKDSDERLIDMGVRVDENASMLTLILVTLDPTTNLYRIEPWKLIIKKNRKNNAADVQDAVDATEQCLTKLREKLNDRMIHMENLTRRVWPMLLSSANDTTYNESLVVQELVLDYSPTMNDSFKIGLIELETFDNDTEILLPMEISEIVKNTSNNVSSLLNDSQNFLRINGTNRLSGDVIIEGDAKFQDLKINFIRTSSLNGQRIDLDDLSLTSILATKAQNFSNSQLRGKNITVHNLGIQQLCGIPKEYWLRAENEASNNIFVSHNLTDVILKNDTVFVRSTRDPLTTSLRDLKLRTINSVDVKDLFDNLFIPGERQIIKGNIFQPIGSATRLSVVHLVAEDLNGISAIDLITRNADQNITGNVFFGGRIVTNSIITKRINGIAIEDFAMVSKKNHFTGQFSVANLRILNQLAIEDSTKFPIVRPIQVYENVTVFGNVKANSVVLESRTNFSLSSMINASDKYWTKSTSQTISDNIRFDAGLSIDELTVHYLNDLDPNVDIMFTTEREISPKLYSLEFKNFTAKQFIGENNNSTANNSSQPLYEDTQDSLIINEEIRIERLSVTELYIQSFNGVPVDVIMRDDFDNFTSSYDYANIDLPVKFETLTVNTRLEIDNLYLTFVCDNDDCRDEHLPGETGRKRLDKRVLRFDENYTFHHLKSKALILGDVTTNNVNANATNNIFDKWDKCFTAKSSSEQSLNSSSGCHYLTIEGDAIIEKNLHVATINEKSSLNYLDELAIEGLVINSDKALIYENLTIRQDLNLNFLHGTRLETLREAVLSKSREQNLGNSKITFFEMSVDDLTVERINDRSMSNLIDVNSENIIFHDNVIFDNLIVTSSNSEVTPDIRTKFINGYSTITEELYEKLGHIPSRVVENLQVRGNIYWQNENNESSENLSTLETITRHALCRNNTSTFVIHTNNTISSSTRVYVASMSTKLNDSLVNGIDIGKILEDSVLDDLTVSPEIMREIRVDGEKIFANNFVSSRLMVSGDIDVRELSRWSIDALNSSIVRSNLSNDGSVLLEMKNRTVIFNESIVARKLVIRNRSKDSSSSSMTIHGSPIDGIFTTVETEDYEKFLPEFTYMKNLVVLNNALVETIDSVNLNDFEKDRVRLDTFSELDSVIHGNIQFNGLVRVSENASIGTINGIAPFDLVINDSTEDQIIIGNDTIITGDMVVIGKTYAHLVAGINLKEAYENSVLNNENTEIFGDIIFQADVEKISDNREAPCEEWKFGEITFESKNDNITRGFVNDISLGSFIDNRKSLDSDFFNNIEKNENNLEESLSRVSNVHLPEIFHYFEPEVNLMITEAANIESVRVTRMSDITILGMYTNEYDNICGLPKDCSCRRQYVAEITANSDDCRSWKVQGPRIFYHFHEPSGEFAVSVATTSVSRTKYCSAINSSTENFAKSLEEFTTISWMKNEQQLVFLHRHPTSSGSVSLVSNVTKDALKIYGYLSDAFVFTQNDLVFIVLAIYYDPIRSTHHTNSFVYVLDLASNTLKLAQNIPTSYAVGVQVFEIPKKGYHIFFSSYADDEPTESVLYRLSTDTAEFRLLRNFPNRGNRRAKIVSRSDEEFLFLDDVATSSISIYRYAPEWDNFYHHQSIYHDTTEPIMSIETFYTGEFRHSHVYVIVTTRSDEFFVYEYTFMSMFQLVSRKRVSGILTMVPFDVSERRYIFVGTESNSTILRIVEQGNSGVMDFD